MQTRRTTPMVLTVLLVAITASGCGSDGADNASVPAPAASKTSSAKPASAPKNPAQIATTMPHGPYVGTWTGRVKNPQSNEFGIAGRFRLRLRSNGTYT